MTMMMTNSQFGLDDMEALLWGPSSPMADAMGSLLFHPDQEEQHGGGGSSMEGVSSPVSPLTSSSLSSSSSSPLPFFSPPHSPPAALLHGDKAGAESDLLSLPCLGHPGQLSCTQTVSYGKEDEFSDLDWMTERMDLSKLDLDSLIGSCNPAEESPSSPEDLLASLDCPMELDSLPIPALSSPVPSSLPSASFPPLALPPVCPDPSVDPADEPVSLIDRQEVPSPSPCVPEPQEELEIKSEPVSPDHCSPLVGSPSSPVCTLDLGSEVDVSESEVKPAVASVVPQVQRLVLSISPTRIVLVLAPKDEVGITTTTVTTTAEVVHPPPAASHPARASRSRPYPEPKYKATPAPPSVTSVKVKSLPGAGGEERPTLKAAKSKKLKKMEQNKTAATRYRQKKRVEQESLMSEYEALERKNMELTEKAESMAREIEYLKELMAEVCSARTKKNLRADP